MKVTLNNHLNMSFSVQTNFYSVGWHISHRRKYPIKCP